MSGSAPTLNAVSESAKAQGLGTTPAATPVKPCELAKGGNGGSNAATKDKPLEYCDIKQVQIVLSTEGKSKTFTIDKDRKGEPINVKAVPLGYHGMLSSHDIVIEALSDIEDTTGSAKTTSKDRKPLDVKVTAVNSVSHTTKKPAHPHTYVGLANSSPAESDGGAPVSGKYFAPDGNALGRTFWGRMWPFGDDRVRYYDLHGKSCGVLPIPQKPIRKLGAMLVVLPYEEWQITIGLKGTREGSYSKEANSFQNQDGKSQRTVQVTTVAKSRVGNVENSTTVQQMQTQSGMNRSRTTTTQTTLDYTLLSANSSAVSSAKDSWTKKPRSKTDDDYDLRKVSIKHTVGGREVECDVTGTIKKILEIKKIIDDAKKLFESVKIGWSISFSYEILSGNINFGWGHRWPASYTEQQRVYYVERFVKVGGQCDVVTGSVTGFFGFAVDPWYAPVAIEIGAYLTTTIKVSIAATIDYAYTNRMLAGSSISGKLEPSASVNFELGAKANGRAFGYSVESKLALEAAASLTFEGKVSTLHPPYLKGTFLIGKEHEGTEANAPKADAIRLIGEVIVVGETTRRWKIDPIVLCKGMEVFKDRYFWGEAPKEG